MSVEVPLQPTLVSVFRRGHFPGTAWSPGTAGVLGFSLQPPAGGGEFPGFQYLPARAPGLGVSQSVCAVVMTSEDLGDSHVTGLTSHSSGGRKCQGEVPAALLSSGSTSWLMDSTSLHCPQWWTSPLSLHYKDLDPTHEGSSLVTPSHIPKDPSLPSVSGA